MKPWEHKTGMNDTKEEVSDNVKKIHEVHTEVNEKRISLSLELKILVYMLVFSLLIKSIEIIKNII